MTAVISIALVNYVVIETSSNLLELCMDFAALTILTHFGKVLINMNSFKGYLLDLLHKKKWYSKMFKIETTTSNDARDIGNDFL